MGKRRKGDRVVGSDKSKTLNTSPKKQVSKDSEVEEAEENNNNNSNNNGGGFFGCYLLNSLNPRFKGHSYIGFTVNPRRRIRQHNGEIRCGAHRTKSKRPWEMALCIYGFPSNVSALQFEWAWQHPTESLAVRKAAVAFKSLSGIANKIKLAFTMLTLPTWQSLNLTVNFFSTKYQMHCAGCPCLPEHMKVQVCSMDELPCYTGYDQNVYQNEELEIEECEGTENGTFYNNSLDHENESTECVKAHGDCTEVMEPAIHETGDSSGFCRNRKEEKTPDFSQNIEENSFNQPINESEGDDHTQPPFPIESPESAIPSASLLETFERGSTPLGSPCSVEMVWSSRESLQMREASVKNKPLVKSSTVLCNVEVIDVCTPEPSCGIGLQPKKRRIDFSEIIDLTESPIFILS